jgi:hypothetical protein
MIENVAPRSGIVHSRDLPAVAFDDGATDLVLQDRPGARRARQRDVARRFLDAPRCSHLGDGLVRSGNHPDVLGHGQPESRMERRPKKSCRQPPRRFSRRARHEVHGRAPRGGGSGRGGAGAAGGGRASASNRTESESYGAVRALDPNTGDKKWEFKVVDYTEAGVLTTASDLRFSGGREGHFFALDGRTGELVANQPWRHGRQQSRDVCGEWEAVRCRLRGQHAVVFGLQ